MRVSTRGRYALRLMLDLAMNNTGEPVRLKDVAKRQEISEKYLEQIISILNKAGFVKSVRGPAGGYSLKPKAALPRSTASKTAPTAAAPTSASPFCSGRN